MNTSNYPKYYNCLLILCLLFTFPLYSHPQDFLARKIPKRETRAVWLTTLDGLDWPSCKALSVSGIEKQIPFPRLAYHTWAGFQPGNHPGGKKIPFFLPPCSQDVSFSSPVSGKNTVFSPSAHSNCTPDAQRQYGRRGNRNSLNQVKHRLLTP